MKAFSGRELARVLERGLLRHLLKLAGLKETDLG